MSGACSAYGETGGIYRFLVGKQGKNHLEDPGIDGRIILNGSSGSGMGECGLD